MKIHVLSDLHIEFSAYNMQVLNADVIVLAGDIGVGIKGIEYAMQLLEITKSKILYVMGNHEACHHNIDTIRRTLRQLCSPEKAFEVEQRLYFLDNDQVIIDGVRFLGCTLWTDFRLFVESKRF
jgi:predicted phosphodiesterase